MQDLGGTVTKEDVDALAIKQVDSVIFDLTDDLGNKQTSKALETYDNLIYQKEPAQKILVMLYNHFKRLYICSLAIESRKKYCCILRIKAKSDFFSKQI